MKDLRACLDGYRSVGEVESEGEFTLSRSHAEKKLQDFRLPEARLYVLNLVSACLCGGASFIDFRADADELWMATDLKVDDLAPLEELSSIVFASQTHPALKELAVGVNGSLQLSPSLVKLEVWGETEGIEVRWEGSGFQATSTSPQAEIPGARFYIKEKPGFRTARKFAGALGGGMVPDPEEDAIFRYCNRAPIGIEFNGKQVNRPLILGTKRFRVFADRELGASHPLLNLGRRKPLPSPGNYTGLLARGGRLAPWVTLVVNGVNFRMPENAFQASDLRGVVYVDFLAKDLSQVQLVQDAQFDGVLEQLNNLARVL